MNRRKTLISLILGALVLFPALAPAPRRSEDPARMKVLAEAKAVVARKIVDFYADARLAPPGNRPDVQGVAGAEQSETWTRLLIDARLDAAAGPAERLAILAEDVERTKALEARIKALGEQAGGFGKIDGFKAEFSRLDAEYRLAKEKAAP